MRFTRIFILLLLPGILCSSIMASAEEKANLKILTWNIQMLPTALDKFSSALQKGQRLRAPWVIEFLNQQDYDMVVLQEVIDRPLTETIKQGLASSYPYIIAPESAKGFSGATGGNLIASKIPIQYVTHIVFKNIAGVDIMAEKGCTLVEGEKDGVRFQIAATHMQAGHQEMKDKEYAEVAGGIIIPYRKEGVPQFLIGDLNTQPGTDKFRLLLDLTEMQEFPIDDPNPYTSAPENSWHHDKSHPDKPDHILLNPRGTGTTILRQTIQRARKEQDGKTIDLSDHYGLIAEVVLKE